jgi:hypothetical protein
MRKLLVAFGDSWTFGSELDKPQQDAWPQLVANKIGAGLVNLGTPASSIGHLTVQLFNFLDQYPNYKDYQTIFMVGLTAQSRYLSYSNASDEFVNITPDAVYRTGDIRPTGQSPEDIGHLLGVKELHYKLVDHKNYSKFLATQVVFLFQQFTNHNNIDAIFFSYFDQLNLDQYFIDKHTILPETITKLISGQDYAVPAIRDNFYFKHKLFHPNEHGHQAIADLLLDFYEKNYSN